jgi:hypothetical protein
MFILVFNYFPWLLHCMVVSDVADASEVQSASIFRVNVRSRLVSFCMYIAFYFVKGLGEEELSGVNDSCRPVATVDGESHSDGPTRCPEMHRKTHLQLTLSSGYPSKCPPGKTLLNSLLRVEGQGDYRHDSDSVGGLLHCMWAMLSTFRGCMLSSSSECPLRNVGNITHIHTA